MEQADILISGAGGSGLSMAYYLSKSPWRDKRIFLLDQAQKECKDRTWCFWTKEKPAFKSAQTFFWEALHFEGRNFSKTASIAPYRYYYLQGSAFYKEVKAHLAAFPNITFLQETVKDIYEEGNKVFLQGDTTRSYQASWLFNSIPQFSPHFPLPEDAVKQYFKGYFIESEEAVFHTQAATLMDFSFAQEAQSILFFYVLPFSPYKALVECTVFSTQAHDTESFVPILERYIHQKLKIKHFHVQEEEQGVIPMHVLPPIRDIDSRVFHIGTAGGMTKASTGYTFGRIQEACADFVSRWADFNKAPTWQQGAARHRFYDQLLLGIIRKRPQLLATIMEALFKKNNFRDIVDFLEEKSSYGQELRLISRLPFQPFLQAFYEKYCLAKQQAKPQQKPWEGVVVGDSAHP